VVQSPQDLRATVLALAERAAVRDGPPPCSSPEAVRQSSATIASRTVLWKRESWPSARGSPCHQSTVEDPAQSEPAKQWIDEAVGQSGCLNVLYHNAASVECAHRVNDVETVDGNAQR
jgi:hypothetical protein